MERATAPVRTGGGERRAASLASIAVLALIAAAIVKPWGVPGAPAPVVAARSASAVAEATAAPAPTQRGVTDEDLVAPFCLSPSGWRVFATERWSNRGLRSWQAADAASAASGPSDPTIPVTTVSSQWIQTLGYCAPVDGPDRPPPDSTVTLYRIPGGASGDVPSPQVVAAHRLQPVLRPSTLGADFAPPVSAPPATIGPASGWHDGTYVFRIDGPAGSGFVRWLGVRLDVLPSPLTIAVEPGSSDGPQPAASH
ncbi:MAG TPA: hypothetical protein VGC90_04480 [Candidatus Limnocylindrales bacterium]